MSFFPQGSPGCLHTKLSAVLISVVVLCLLLCVFLLLPENIKLISSGGTDVTTLDIFPSSTSVVMGKLKCDSCFYINFKS